MSHMIVGVLTAKERKLSINEYKRGREKWKQNMCEREKIKSGGKKDRESVTERKEREGVTEKEIREREIKIVLERKQWRRENETKIKEN